LLVHLGSQAASQRVQAILPMPKLLRHPRISTLVTAPNSLKHFAFEAGDDPLGSPASLATGYAAPRALPPLHPRWIADLNETWILPGEMKL